MIIQLTFPEINVSLQIGDAIFVVPQVVQNGGFDVGNSVNSYYLGFVSTIAAPGTQFNPSSSATTYIVYVDAGDYSGTIPTENDYIFFVKDERTNLSSLVGSYGEAKFVNDSREPAEMFAASCEISQSSK